MARAAASAGGKRPSALRRRTLLLGLMAAACAVTVRALQLSVIQTQRWESRAQEQQSDSIVLPAPRGTIFDRDGVPLAASRERYTIAIARPEIDDAAAVIEALRANTKLSAREIRRHVEGGDAWNVLPGRYDESVRSALAGLGGVHFERVTQRFYPHRTLAGEMLGSVNSAGDALGGLELEYDALLRGQAGSAVVRRDSHGRPLPGLMLRAVEPVPGHDVVLTIDVDLQEIADDALLQAVENTGAAGGELVLVEPATGEVLAAVSRRSEGAARNWGAVTVPYEPGSTLKPFTVAMLLAERRASLSDSIFGENGRYTTFGRTITDVHAHGWLTLADALRESSNIGIAKAAEALDPEMQYDYLRRFGFGSPTGVSYPSESGGLLRRPDHWSKQSRASLSIGYEVSVTPLQMAMAYAALANGGVLMEPRLVREVRARDGSIERAFAPRAVRRVVPESVTEPLREVLADVVEEGTGQAASMGAFSVAGKTGTARIAMGGRYVPGAYTATFAGFFPAEDPQLVFVVKLDRPRGAYYGGATAAPVTRATLEAALAARSTPIDKRAIATPAPAAEATVVTVARGAARFASLGAPRTSQAPVLPPVALPVAAEPSPAKAAATPAAEIPDVEGMPLRDAAALLHAAGFRVRVEGSGPIRRTVPAAGERVGGGEVVRIVRGGER